MFFRFLIGGVFSFLLFELLRFPLCPSWLKIESRRAGSSGAREKEREKEQFLHLLLTAFCLFFFEIIEEFAICFSESKSETCQKTVVYIKKTKIFSGVFHAML